MWKSITSGTRRERVGRCPLWRHVESQSESRRSTRTWSSMSSGLETVTAAQLMSELIPSWDSSAKATRRWFPRPVAAGSRPACSWWHRVRSAKDICKAPPRAM